MRKYSVDVFFAKMYYAGETSVAIDLNDPLKPDNEVYDRLAECLDTDAKNPEFDADFATLEIPQSIVERIQREAIAEYRRKQE